MSDFRHAPVAPVLRSLLLDRLYTVKGLTEARAFYDGAAYSPPFGKEFHLKMLELGSVQQSRLSSQFSFQCCNLPQLLNTLKNVPCHLNLHINLQFEDVQNGFQMTNDNPPHFSPNWHFNLQLRMLKRKSRCKSNWTVEHSPGEFGEEGGREEDEEDLRGRDGSVQGWDVSYKLQFRRFNPWSTLFQADLDVWVDFAAFEGIHGKTRDVESVKMRARAALGKDSAEAFDLGCGTRS